MPKNFQSLTQPGQIGSMQLKNRMLVTAMGVSLAEPDGSCGDRIIDFHERQAQGGVGLIILGVAGVSWPAGGNQIGQIAISEDRHIPGLKRMADAVHKHGAKLATQLHHGGLTSPEDMKAGRPVWIPSYPAPMTSDLGNSILFSEMKAFKKTDSPPDLHIMTQADIDTLVEQFAAAAERAKRAGIDGVEIHGGHGYIISGFLSPALNQRDDKYGGSLKNRARLLLEILAAVRDRVGADYPVWVKLDSQEFGRQEGITLADARQTAILVEAAGADAINSSAFHDVSRGALHSESNIPHVPGRLVANAAAIKSVVSIPVITSGRLEPEIANKHIANGKFDFLGMGRKLLADPDLANKIVAGTPEDIRPCVYCYCCVSQIYLSKAVKCAVNPETAYERERALIPLEQTTNGDTINSPHIGVVGGGPAGMEVAHRLASRGFRVSLLEGSGRLGGTLQFAGLAYPPNEKLMNWLRRKIKNSTVEVHLNTLATPERLKSLTVNEVIVATGAQRGMPDIPGAGQDFVFSGEEMRALVLAEKHPELIRKTSSLTRILAATGARFGITSVPELVRQISKVWMPLGKQITIVGAELVGLELAEYLAERGRKVTVIDSAPQAGKGLYLVRRMRLLDELDHLGVTLILKAEDINIGDQNVNYTNPRGQQRRIDVDHVIVAQGATGDTTLAEQLQDKGFKTHTIGDCNGVSYIEGALESAAILAAKLN
jgi:2,4-dienoyl-CoA reductase (NADPH2)